MMAIIFSFSGLTLLLGAWGPWNLVTVGALFTIMLFLKNYPICGVMTGLSYSLGVDWFSFSLILLSIWLMSLMLMASNSVKILNFHQILFVGYLLFLLKFLILTFSILDYMLFYIYFEVSLIPTFLLVLGWGLQPERLQAGLYLMFYTLGASLPLLMGLLYMQVYLYSANFLILSYIGWVSPSIIIYASLVLAFLVKMPLYLVHLWLPKAHVEAPVSGSMILAGVLLKLGGYGLIRLSVVFVGNYRNLSSMWVSLSLLGGGLVSILCLRQSDLKMLVAYSSVAHMSLVISGVFTGGLWGVKGALILMLGHGLCSSALFVLVNLVYERSGSRSLILNQGWINILPSLSLWWFLLGAANMAAPPTLNLAGEIMLITSLVGWSSINMFCLAFISFFSAAYSLFLFSSSQHGACVSSMIVVSGCYTQEYLCLLLHWAPLNLLVTGGLLGS